MKYLKLFEMYSNTDMFDSLESVLVRLTTKSHSLHNSTPKEYIREYVTEYVNNKPTLNEEDEVELDDIDPTDGLSSDRVKKIAKKMYRLDDYGFSLLRDDLDSLIKSGVDKESIISFVNSFLDRDNNREEMDDEEISTNPWDIAASTMNPKDYMRFVDKHFENWYNHGQQNYSETELEDKILKTLHDFCYQPVSIDTPLRTIAKWIEYDDYELFISDLISFIEESFDLDIEFPDIPREFYTIRTVRELVNLMRERYNLA